MSNIERHKKAKEILAELEKEFDRAFNEGGGGIRLVQLRLVVHVDRIRTRAEAERLCRPGDRVATIEYPYIPDWAK